MRLLLSRVDVDGCLLHDCGGFRQERVIRWRYPGVTARLVKAMRGWDLERICKGGSNGYDEF